MFLFNRRVFSVKGLRNLLILSNSHCPYLKVNSIFRKPCVLCLFGIASISEIVWEVSSLPYLFWSQGKWTKCVSISWRWSCLVKHGIGQHRHKQQTQAAWDTLTSCESTLRGSSNNWEPEMSITKVLRGSLSEKMAEFWHLLLAGYWNHSINLGKIEANKVILINLTVYR